MATSDAPARRNRSQARQAPASPEPINLLDLPFHPVGFNQAVDHLVDLARSDGCSYAVTANVDHVVRCSKSPELHPLYEKADLCVADGMPLIWASRLLRTPLPERVAGSDLFPALCERAAGLGLTVFLLGGDPGAADGAAKHLREKHPALQVAGTYCPPFGFENDAAENARIIELIRSARPNILFVALGSPKQEKWIAANRNHCAANLSIGVGISFSFITGQVRRAPRWVQRIGMEWFHRMVQDPARLAKRYLVDDLPFLPMVLRAMLRTRPPGSAKRPSLQPNRNGRATNRPSHA